MDGDGIVATSVRSIMSCLVKSAEEAGEALAQRERWS